MTRGGQGGRMRKGWGALLLVLTAFGVGFAMFGIGAEQRLDRFCGEMQKRYSDVAMIAPDDLLQHLKDSEGLLLDVRTGREYAVSRIPGALRVDDASSWLAHAGKDISRDRPITVYCSVGVRSADFARALQHAGFRNVRNLDGSLFRWANQGLRMENEAGTTAKAHPYDFWWGRFLRGELWQWTSED